MSVLERILDLKDQRGLSDLAFARELGLGERIVDNWKREKSETYYKLIPQIAAYFGVSIEYLYTGNSSVATSQDVVINKNEKGRVIMSNGILNRNEIKLLEFIIEKGSVKRDAIKTKATELGISDDNMVSLLQNFAIASESHAFGISEEKRKDIYKIIAIYEQMETQNNAQKDAYMELFESFAMGEERTIFVDRVRKTASEYHADISQQKNKSKTG